MTTSRIAAALLLSVSLAPLVAAVAAQQATAPAAACTVEALQKIAPKGTTITEATLVQASGDVPQYCDVDGHATSVGNEVDFRVAFPVTWNGKLLFAGVGGLGGSTEGRTTGAAIARNLRRGYVWATTDTGHDADDPDWIYNRAKVIDYGHRGTHVTAVASKALIASYYGRPLQHAYFQGCSNGGKQAMMEVQRYPDDFDGVIAGDPATGTPMQVGRALVFQHLLASKENYLTPEKVDMLSKATLEACDLADGLKDGLVSEPRKCNFKPESLKCAGPEGPNCLTAGQVKTVEMIYAGLKLPNGDTYTTGFPFGHEGGATGWQGWITGRTAATLQADGSLAFGTGTGARPSGFRLSEENMKFALENDDRSYTWRTVKFPQDLPRLQYKSDILSPLDPNLTPFMKRGGKLLVYHGTADPAISVNGSIEYHEKMIKAVGGQQAADSFSRLYLVPGMHHCSGGPGPNSFDMLTALENWVEKGIPPAAIVASHATGTRTNPGPVDRTRPLCPYPQVARYTGTGSIDEAANFRCEAPR